MNRSAFSVVLGILLIIITPPLPTNAQSSDWECTWDFTTAEGVWRVFNPDTPRATYVAGAGYRRGTSVTNQIVIETHPTSRFSGQFTEVTMTFNRTFLLSGIGSLLASIRESGTDTAYISKNIKSANTTIQLTNTSEIVYTADSDILSVGVVNHTSPGTINAIVSDLTLTGVIFRGTGTAPSDSACTTIAPVYPTLTRPMADDDIHMFIQPTDDYVGTTEQLIQQGAMIALSEKTEVPVSAVSDGVITSIDKVGTGTCNDLTIRLPAAATAGGSALGNPLDFSTESERIMDCELFLMNTENYPRYRFRGFTQESWIVTITSDDGYIFKQLVANPEKYVVEGQRVTSGCWIGDAYRGDMVKSSTWLQAFGTAAGATINMTPFTSLAFGVLLDAVNSYDTPFDSIQSATVVWTFDGPSEIFDAVNAFDWFTVSPSQSAPCNVPSGFEGCFGDFELKQRLQWNASAGAIFNAPGFTLPPNEFISSTYNLLASEQPELVIRGVSLGGSPARVQLRLGTTVNTLDFIDNESLRIPAAAHTSDLGDGLYTVQVKNVGNSTLDIDYVCVRHTVGLPAPTEPPDDGTPSGESPSTRICAFSNHSFDDASGWAYSGATTRPGEIGFRNGNSITQTITLAPNTYYLTLIIAVWDYGAYTGTPTDTTDASFRYAWNGGGYNPVGTITYGELLQKNNLAVLSTTVTISTLATGIFEINAQLPTLPSGVQGIALRSACLSTEEDPLIDQGEEGGGLFEPICNVIPTPPVGAGVGTWTSWLWANMGSFYQCDLMKLLNAQYSAIRSFFTTMRWSIVWFMTTTRAGVAWVGNEALPYIAGYIANVVPSNITNNEQCNNFFCLLDSLIQNALSPIIDLVRWVIENVFFVLLELVSLLANLIFTIITKIVEFIQTVLGLITTIFDAYNNATPVSILGFNCDTAPESSPLCSLYWALDNTFLSGTNGQLYIPIVTTWLSIHIAIYAISKIWGGVKNAIISA